MQFQYQMNQTAIGEPESREAMFILVETGQAADISKGYLTAFDCTDTSGVDGIGKSTRGARVIVYPVAEEGGLSDAKCRQAGFAAVTIPGYANFATLRSQYYPIQVWGYSKDVWANTEATDSEIKANGGILVPAPDEAGAVCGVTGATTVTSNELLKKVGTYLESSDVTVAAASRTIEAWVHCL